MKDKKKKQIEFLKIKKKLYLMKISLAEINSKLDTAEGKASSNRKYPK